MPVPSMKTVFRGDSKSDKDSYECPLRNVFIYETLGSHSYSRTEAAEDLENDVLVENIVGLLLSVKDQMAADFVSSRMGPIHSEHTQAKREACANLLRKF